MNVKDLKPGMVVIHESWDCRTSEPMEVVEVDGEILLRVESMPDTEPLAGGESEDGWFEI